MRAWKLLFLSTMSLSLLSCGYGDDEKYEGVAPLSGDQKLTAATAISQSDKIERALEVASENKEADEDLTEILELLEPCGKKGSGEVVGDILVGERELYGLRCPVTYEKSYQYRFEQLNDGYKIISGFYKINYTTDNTALLQLVDIQSADFRVDRHEGGTYSLSASFNSQSLGLVRISDQMSIRETNAFQIVTFFRALNLKGFRVEARVIFNIDKAYNDLKSIELYLNGQRVTPEEMTSIYPTPFDWFADGRRFKDPSSKRN